MGLIEVFDRNEFEKSMEACYSDPLHVDPSFLCLLYLVFAIGLVLAVPTPNTREDAIIKQLRGPGLEWAERFYRGAKHLGDPVSGFEDADFWSIQALLLMSVYTLSISKRNAAYAYYGKCSIFPDPNPPPKSPLILLESGLLLTSSQVWQFDPHLLWAYIGKRPRTTSSSGLKIQQSGVTCGGLYSCSIVFFRRPWGDPLLYPRGIVPATYSRLSLSPTELGNRLSTASTPVGSTPLSRARRSSVSY